jgi:hypothetical protein
MIFVCVACDVVFLEVIFVVLLWKSRSSFRPLRYSSPFYFSELQLLLLFTWALCSSTVRAFCGCVSAGLLRKVLKFPESSFEREPLVAAGMD